MLSFKDSVVSLFIYVPTCLTGKYEEYLGQKAYFESTFVDLSEKLYTTSKKMGQLPNHEFLRIQRVQGRLSTFSM